MTRLTLDQITLTLDDTPVLSGIDLHVDEGEFVALLGPSGCGKSTLFRLLTGAVQLDQGTMRFGDVALSSTTKTFAFMPQRDALLPWSSILDNITLGLEVQGMARQEARAQVLPLLPAFGLADFAEHYPAQLSGGMRQRAAFLRTIILERPIQLLDEPFGALDALTRMTMQRWLETRRQQASEQGKSWTTLLVTHDVREAVALSDRIYVLSRRPARVIDHVEIGASRPRFGVPLSAEAVRLEAHLLQTLLNQTGDD